MYNIIPFEVNTAWRASFLGGVLRSLSASCSDFFLFKLYSNLGS